LPTGKRFSDLSSTKYKFVDADPDKCIGCGICELVCSIEKSERKHMNTLESRIVVTRLHPAINIATTCRLCDKAPCVRSCPYNALIQSMENGIIIVDESKCTGCTWCIKACDYGAITIDPKKKVPIICDLCKGRKGIGVWPGRKITSQACIEWCPEEALELVTSGKLAQKAREKASTKLFSVVGES